MMNPVLERAVADALGRRVTSSRAVAGGDINQAFAVTLEGGARVFVKTHPSAPRTMFPAEARGLAWLRESATLRVPQVLAVSATEGRGPCFLVLEHVEPGRRDPAFDEKLGRGLAALHRFGAPHFGLDHDNFIGSLEQANGRRAAWADFYRDLRLEPLVARATERGLFGVQLRREFERLLERLDSLVGPAEPPARLHGDLWGGNLHVDERGQPCLIDPAVYGGHREIDLAMMRLFGGFGPGVFDAYEEAWPLAAGHERRVPLYQLYPLLVHVNLFGSGYVGQATRALRDALAA
jgi:fructosamine-3-kinase